MVVFGLGKDLLFKSVLGHCTVNEDFSYLKSTMESFEFVEAIKSGFP